MSRASIAILVLALVGAGCKSKASVRNQSPTPTPVRDADSEVVAARVVVINGRELKDKEWAILLQLEREHEGKPLPNGWYWYDKKSGLFGIWNGPAAAVIPAGLKLGGSLKADCSGRGTNVFINGREIPPIEKLYYEKLLAQQIPLGRYTLDDRGNLRVEGPSALEVLVFVAAAAQASQAQAQAQQSQGGGWVSGRSYANTFSSGESGGANGAWSHSADYGGGRVMVAGDNSGGGVMVDGKCVTWGW